MAAPHADTRATGNAGPQRGHAGRQANRHLQVALRRRAGRRRRGRPERPALLLARVRGPGAGGLFRASHSSPEESRGQIQPRPGSRHTQGAIRWSARICSSVKRGPWTRGRRAAACSFVTNDRGGRCPAVRVPLGQGIAIASSPPDDALASDDQEKLSARSLRVLLGRCKAVAADGLRPETIVRETPARRSGVARDHRQRTVTLAVYAAM